MDYDKLTDEQLIAQLRAGEEEITDYLMEKYKGLVRQKAKAMYLLGGENDDLIQEGMIGLFKALQNYQEEAGASFHSFAELCISRQIYSAIKSAQRNKHIPLNFYISLYAQEGDYDDGKAAPLVETIEAGEESNPEELFVKKEYAQVFEAELTERLSKMEKSVLQLHLMGLDYLKIAEIMGKSPKVVDNALQRIKTKAKELLEKTD